MRHSAPSADPRGAVVKPGTAIPATVPGVQFQVSAQASACGRALIGEGRVAVQARQRAESAQHFVQEEAQPHALPLAYDAHPVHAVVPVAGANQRRAVGTEAQSVPDGPHTMPVQALCLPGAAGQIVVELFLRIELASRQEGDGFASSASPLLVSEVR